MTTDDKEDSTKANGKPSAPPHPSNVFTMTQQQQVMVNSQSTTNEKQLNNSKGNDSKNNNTAISSGSSTYLLSQSTTAPVETQVTTPMPSDCAPSRDSSSKFLNSKSIDEPAATSHEQTPTRLYLSKPQTNIHNRPIPTAPTESIVMDNSSHSPVPITTDDDFDLEAPSNNNTSGVYVHAEVARDMDSIVNQAVTEALRERDRNIVSAVQVEPLPMPGEDDDDENNDTGNKADLQDGSLIQEERKKARRQVLLCLGVVGVVAIVVAVLVFLQTSATSTSGSDSSANHNPTIGGELVGNNTSTTNGDDDDDSTTTTPTFSPSSSLPWITETKQFPLSLCQGDCDDDADCREGLVCFQRNEFEPVPHCAGGETDESRTDYCIPRGPTVSPSAAPTGPTFWPSWSPSTSPTPKPTQDLVRFEAITESLGDDLFPYHSQALEWLLQNDTWIPPEDATDPSGLWRERYAFATLYFDTNGPFWEVKGRWLSEESVCRWNGGIRCNVDGKVDYVYISDWSHIVGSIPSELKALTKLSHLDFSSHELGGSFPSEIGMLSLLTRLDLRSNELSGTIPTEIGMLSKLEGLYLRQNNLVGGLPSEIGRLTNLQYTFLDSNLISGSIPTEIGLTELRDISGFNNRWTGPIPSEIGLLTNMEALLLYDNELTGPIISEIGLLTNLKWLSLYDNALVGNIPSELGRLTNMFRLHLSDNRLTGTVPDEFGVLFLEYLNLARNQLTGVFPVMTFDSRDSDPRCFMESNRFDDTSNAPSCRF